MLLIIVNQQKEQIFIFTVLIDRNSLVINDNTFTQIVDSDQELLKFFRNYCYVCRNYQLLLIMDSKSSDYKRKIVKELCFGKTLSAQEISVLTGKSLPLTTKMLK